MVLGAVAGLEIGSRGREMMALHGTTFAPQAEDHGRVARPTRVGAALVSVAASFPAQGVPTADIAAPLGVEPDWLIRRTGVESRRRIGAGECLCDLAADAARRALTDADVEPAAVD